MKRMVALLIALVLTLSCTAVLADDFGITYDEYRQVADMLNANAGIEVEWIDRTEDKGYIAHQGIAQNLSNTNSIWVYFEPVIGVEAVYVLNLEADNLTALGNEFGQLATSAVISAWMAQHQNDADLVVQLTAMQANLEDEMTQLLAPLFELSEESLKNGIRNEGTFCGIPAVFMMEGDIDTMDCKLYIFACYDLDLIANYN